MGIKGPYTPCICKMYSRKIKIIQVHVNFGGITISWYKQDDCVEWVYKISCVRFVDQHVSFTFKRVMRKMGLDRNHLPYFLHTVCIVIDCKIIMFISITYKKSKKL